MLNIAFGQSKYFVDNLRENVKRGLRQKIRNGVWPGWAPVGYLNNPRTRNIDVDEVKAKKVRQLFELYSTGKYTLNSLANWAEENKLTGSLAKRISISNINSILQNIFYIGLMRYNGEIHEGKHQPIISKKLFDVCQEVMKDRGKPRKKENHHFAFLGLMKCKSCGCAVTAETQKGHNYYRCTKKKGICQEKHYLREENLVEQIKNYLQKVSLSSQDTEKVLFDLEKEEAKAKEQAKDSVQNLKSILSEVEQKLEKLIDIYLSEVITTEEYTLRKQKLISEKLSISEKIGDFEQKGLSWLEPARKFVLSLAKADKLKNSGNYPEILTFLKNIGSNHYLQNRKWHFEAKIPYNFVAAAGGANSHNLTFPYWYPW